MNIIIYGKCAKCSGIINLLDSKKVDYIMVSDFNMNFIMDKGFTAGPIIQIDNKYYTKDEVINFLNVNSSSDANPLLIVTAPSKSNIIIQKDDITLESVEDNGVWQYGIPEFGTWIITAELNGNTTVQEVTIEKNKAYNVQLSYFINPLYFTALEDTDISWNVFGKLKFTPQLFYAIDNNERWIPYQLNETIHLEQGQKCYWYGSTNTFNESLHDYINFRSSGKVEADGNIDSLINFARLTFYCYCKIFKDCKNLIKAPTLGAEIMVKCCYTAMFEGCSGLINAPELLSNSLASGCYAQMFKDCINLKEAPKLLADYAVIGCYYEMFNNCQTLSKIPELPATKLGNQCYRKMFINCSNIRLSEEQTDEFNLEYKIPNKEQGESEFGATIDMFKDTGGPFVGTPDINKIYFTA